LYGQARVALGLGFWVLRNIVWTRYMEVEMGRYIHGYKGTSGVVAENYSEDEERWEQNRGESHSLYERGY
jgi:hypothetical protein